LADEFVKMENLPIQLKEMHVGRLGRKNRFCFT